MFKFDRYPIYTRTQIWCGAVMLAVGLLTALLILLRRKKIEHKTFAMIIALGIACEGMSLTAAAMAGEWFKTACFTYPSYRNIRYSFAFTGLLYLF